MATGKTKNQRVKTAQAILEKMANLDNVGKPNGGAHTDPLGEEGADVSGGPMKEGRSTDEASSHLFQPRWRRLLKVAAKTLAERIENSDQENANAGVVRPESMMRLIDIFTCKDAIGGGTKEDVQRILTTYLEGLRLSDRDTGSLILFAVKAWQARDLPWSGVTWRPLVLTGLLVCVDRVLGPPTALEAKSKLLKQAGHWWTSAQAERAAKEFQDLPSFKSLDMGRSAMARLYFEMRDDALVLSPDASESFTGGGSVMKTDGGSERNLVVTAAAKLLQTGHLSDFSGLSDTLLQLSADSSILESSQQTSGDHVKHRVLMSL